MNPEQVRLFDEWAEGYDRSIQAEGGFPFSGYEAVLDRVVVLADPKAGHHILDLGVGTGNLAKRFVDLGCEVSGVDVSARMLALAREKVPGLQVAESDIAGVWPAGFADRFDRIVSSYTFHHFDLQSKVTLLRRLVERHLSPGGVIVVGDVCFSTVQSLAEARILAGDRWDDSEHYWVVSETVAASEMAGLSVRHSPVSDCAAVFVFGPGARP
jgi:putative AdoMet-dependent methyltransferase